ncbi:hypothetical protein KEM54_005066 [Ascosphaera aggregata]|nr:hypothetical protein KEM54_005066 [Ascosphaera aggregata]
MLCQRCRHLFIRAINSSSSSSTLIPAAFTYTHTPLLNYSLRAYSTPATATDSAAAAFLAPSSVDSAAVAASSPSTTSPNSTKQNLHGPSSVPAGTPLKGINYYANKPDPVALADEEYPSWLWNLVLDHKAATTTADGVNIAEMTKKQRKRHMKKMAALAADQPKVIPVHEQSIDITPANVPLSTEIETLTAAGESLEQRLIIRKSARAARRKAIRESNYLKGM